MDACEAVRPTSLWKLGEAVSKVAESDTAQDRDQAESSDGDARACVKRVQQEHQSGDYCGRDGE